LDACGAVLVIVISDGAFEFVVNVTKFFRRANAVRIAESVIDWRWEFLVSCLETILRHAVVIETSVVCRIAVTVPGRGTEDGNLDIAVSFAITKWAPWH
jgi:hypothetical protein